MPIMNFSPSLGIQVEEMIIMKYHDRGDPAVEDFGTADFTIDGLSHDLDLSAIVPATAAGHMVHLGVNVTSVTKLGYLHFRKKGNDNWWNASKLYPQVLSQAIYSGDIWVILDADRVISYAGEEIDAISLTVRGWVTD